MVLKRGSQWKHFWRTCTSPAIVPSYALRLTIGANTTMYPSNHPPLRQLPLLFSHILHIPMSTSLNRTKRYRTSFIFYSHAGDVRPNTTHKVPLFLYLGHHGDLHHLLHHRQLFTGPYIPIALPPLLTMYIVHWMRTTLARWICPTPVYNTPHHFAEWKKNNDLTSIRDYSLSTPSSSMF